MPALIDMLRPYSDLILPIFFIGFFVVTFTSVYLYKNDRIRTTYITGFLVLLLVMNTVAPVSVLPFINWHKFSDPRAAEQTTYEVRIVDANGRELRYDPKATLKSEGVYMLPLPTKMANEYSDEKIRKSCSTS